MSNQRGGEKMGQAIFYLEKFVKDGKEYVKVLGWGNVLEYSELPKEYFEEYLDTAPYFYYSLNGTRGKIVLYFESHWADIYVGTYMRKEHWEKLEKYMKQAGKRLSEINKKLKWHGKFKAVI